MKILNAQFSRSAWARALLVLFAGMFVLSFSLPAQAGGRVKWKSTTIKERLKNNSWRLEMEFHLSRPPAIAHKSMKFEFTQVSEYERALVDGREGPQELTVRLSGQQSQIESVMVGFLDSGSGKIQSRTRFSFKVTRAHGYKAGKWKVKIRDGETGSQIGQVTTLNFKGENPVVDRRSITFHGKDKKKKEESKEEESASDDSASDQSDADESTADDVDSDEFTGSDEGNIPPSIEEKPGGGCHHAPLERGPWAPILFSFALAGLFWMRRRTD